MKISQQTSQTIAAGAICAFGIAVFVVVLYHNVTALRDMNNEIKKLSVQLEEHRTLQPVFNTLLEEIRKQKKEGIISYPEKSKLSRENMQTAMDLFKTIAELNQLKIKAIEPEIDSISESSGYLIMNMMLEGDFFNLRGMLMQLGQIPWFEKIERFQISAGDGVKEIQLKISLSIT